MPTFFIIDGIKILFYFNDHNPPHFHALFGGYELVIEIKTLKIMEGNLPKSQLKKVKAFATENQEILLEIWDQMRDQ